MTASEERKLCLGPAPDSPDIRSVKPIGKLSESGISIIAGKISGLS